MPKPKAQRKKVPLGRGTLTPPAESTRRAQLLFLRAIAEQVPAVWATLKQDVLPVQNGRWPEFLGDDPFLWPLGPRLIRTCFDTDGRLSPGVKVSWLGLEPPDTQRLRALLKWCKRWNLETFWVVMGAWQLLSKWSQDPNRLVPEILNEALEGCEVLHLAPPGPVEVRGTWDPTNERRDDAERRFTGMLRGCLDRIERRYRESGEADLSSPLGFFLEGTRETPSKQAAHFRWLAAYQCSGVGYESIARSCHRSRQSVTDAVVDTASLVSLKLRPAKPGGRPKNEK
jgi:hypothetical protein